MDENRDNVQKEEYQVIREQIVPKKKNNWKRLGKGVFRATVYGVVFGLVAGVMFVLSGGFLFETLGLESTLRQIVAIGSPTQVPETTKAPDADASSKVTGNPEKAPTPPQLTAAAPDLVVTIDGTKNETESGDDEAQESVRDFVAMYSEIAKQSNEWRMSLVQIAAITEGVDWFEESYEIVKKATGLYVGDNGLDMLFLANLDSIEGATKFNITFAGGETLPCSIFAYDTNYRLAVLSVRKTAVAALPEGNQPTSAEFALEEVQTGTPMLVLGNPNGNEGAMEFGMITGTGQMVQVVDDEVGYFTTGITEYAEGDGVVFNLSGEVIGIVSHTLNKGEEGVITAVEISDIQKVIEYTLNNVPRIYCGMRLESVDVVMGEKYKLPEGIYVTEVLTGSPAMYAGIKNGDIITEVGAASIAGVRQFYEEISANGARSVRIVVSRDTKGERKEQELYLTPETRLH